MRTALLSSACLLLAACHERQHPTLIEELDITSDLHHRVQAGLFLPDREPLVLEVLGADGEAEGATFRLRSELGAFWARSADSGGLVVYWDTQSFFSHWSVGCDRTTARVFNEWPVHPIE